MSGTNKEGEELRKEELFLYSIIKQFELFANNVFILKYAPIQSYLENKTEKCFVSSIMKYSCLKENYIHQGCTD